MSTLKKQSQYIPFIILALSLSVTSFAKEKNQLKVNRDKSHIHFTYTQMGVPVKGDFPHYTPHIVFDHERPDTAQIQFDIEIPKINAGSEEANTEASSKNWLSAAQFPVAQFIAKTVTPVQNKADHFEAIGDLIIKGKKQSVTIPFTAIKKKQTTIFNGQFLFPRAHFNIGEAEWKSFDIVANDIQINFHIEAQSTKR